MSGMGGHRGSWRDPQALAPGKNGTMLMAEECLPSPLPCTLQNPEELQRLLRKKQKNRAAAQRSRQKHTDKADTLHQVGPHPVSGMLGIA